MYTGRVSDWQLGHFVVLFSEVQRLRNLVAIQCVSVQVHNAVDLTCVMIQLSDLEPADEKNISISFHKCDAQSDQHFLKYMIY